MERYGISRITVTHALQELAQQGYIKRFRSKGFFVCDRKEGNRAAGGDAATRFHNTRLPSCPFPPLRSRRQVEDRYLFTTPPCERISVLNLHPETTQGAAS